MDFLPQRFGHEVKRLVALLHRFKAEFHRLEVLRHVYKHLAVLRFSGRNRSARSSAFTIARASSSLVISGVFIIVSSFWASVKGASFK